MADANQADVIPEERLNDVDRQLLALLREGRITPTLAMKLELPDKSRQYINQRLVRLAEHGHVENLEGTGVYELVDDPMEGGSD